MWPAPGPSAAIQGAPRGVSNAPPPAGRTDESQGPPKHPHARMWPPTGPSAAIQDACRGAPNAPPPAGRTDESQEPLEHPHARVWPPSGPSAAVQGASYGPSSLVSHILFRCGGGSMDRMGPLRASQRLHLEREVERGSRSEAVRTAATPVLPPVRKRKQEREKLPFGTIDARL